MEGIVRGNVYAQDVKVKNNGMLFGDIQCVSLTVDPTASVKVEKLYCVFLLVLFCFVLFQFVVVSFCFLMSCL